MVCRITALFDAQGCGAVQKEFLFQSSTMMFVRSSWERGPRTLPLAWQSEKEPRISFLHAPILLGARHHNQLALPGQAVLFDGMIEHGVRRPGDHAGSSLWIGVHPDMFAETLDPAVRECMNRRTTYPVISPDLRAVLLTQMLARMIDREHIDPIVVESILYDVLRLACGRVVTPASRKEQPASKQHIERVLHAITLLDQNDPSLTLETVGRSVHLSPHHFCRVFRRVTGLSVHGYRCTQRVLRTANHLMDADESLSSIAHTHGFSDQSHMTRDIKARLGVTPAQLVRCSQHVSHMRTVLQEN